MCLPMSMLPHSILFFGVHACRKYFSFPINALLSHHEAPFHSIPLCLLMTSSFSALLAFVRRIHRSPVNSQRPVARSFDLRLNKRLSKQSWGGWFETPSCSLWRHCNGEPCICLEGTVTVLYSVRCFLFLLHITIYSPKRINASCA